MQSSVAEGGIPQKAVDGSSSNTFSSDTCTLTTRERQPWWYVNLLEPYMVQLVRLDFGQSCCGDQPATIVVRVGNNRPDLAVNPICNRFVGLLEEGRPLFLPCNPPMPGAFVSVHFEAPPGAQLSICEAFVYTDQALPIERCPSFRDQPPGSTATYNGKCYIFYNQQPRNFDNALEFCRSRGGSLVDETNPALQGFLSWELWRKHRGDPNGQYWMGAVRDPEDINNWKWINGRDVTVSFWNLPGGNENCARFDGTKGWLWSDTNCNFDLNFICQHRPQTCEADDGDFEWDRRLSNGTYTLLTGSRYYLSIVRPSFLVSECCVGHPTAVTCDAPPPLLHGSTNFSSPTVTVGVSVAYSCDIDYVLVGPRLITCTSAGTFNQEPPRCQVDEATKPDLTESRRPGSRRPDHPRRPNQQRPRPPYLAEVEDNYVEANNPSLATVLPSLEAGHDNKINNINDDRGQSIDGPSYDLKEEGGAKVTEKLHLGGIIALGVFGGFVFLAAVITTIVILVRRYPREERQVLGSGSDHEGDWCSDGDDGGCRGDGGSGGSEAGLCYLHCQERSFFLLAYVCVEA
nr:uncharacterized protein LOC128690449 [Cherax quadricarinatus]